MPRHQRVLLQFQKQQLISSETHDSDQQSDYAQFLDNLHDADPMKRVFNLAKLNYALSGFKH